MRILLTGATGNVGRQVAKELVDRGCGVICLIRGKNGRSARDRLRQTFGDEYANQLHVLEGDLENVHELECPNCPDLICHVAAVTDLNSDLCDSVNVGGTKNIIQFARRNGVPRIGYIGTAFVAGQGLPFLPEMPDGSGFTFRSAADKYIASKQKAEPVIVDWGGEYWIGRLGVVVEPGYFSDRDTSSSFTAYYDFAKTLLYLKIFILRAWRKDPDRLREVGIICDDEIVYAPLNLPASATFTINVVPTSWVGRTLALLCERGKNETIYHVTHPNPPFMRDMAWHTMNELGIRGMTIGASPITHPNPVPKELQEWFNKSAGYIYPYMNCATTFEHKNCSRDLREEYELPDPITRETFHNWMTWALGKHNLGIRRKQS